jgi:hypothetical protein
LKANNLFCDSLRFTAVLNTAFDILKHAISL